MSKSRMSSGDWTGEFTGSASQASSMAESSSGSRAAAGHDRDGAGNRVCDNCKKKKIRCKGARAPSTKCLNCTVESLECTYQPEEKKRRRPKGYIEELQDRIRELEGALHKLCPDEKLLKEIHAQLNDDSQSQSDPTAASSALGHSLRVQHELIRKFCRMHMGPGEDPFREEASETALLHRLEMIRDAGGRFYGNAGTTSFIRAAVESKTGATGTNVKRRLVDARRQYFWDRKPWELEIAAEVPVRYTFPPEDLMLELVDAYFEHVNLILPLLHRPTFERSIADDLHIRDEDFGGVVLLVCAIGSRYTSCLDERVMLDGVESPFSAGYKWFIQVQIVRNRLLDLPRVYDLQIYALAAQFVQGKYPHPGWTFAGIGIRVAQDMGLHQRRLPIDKLTVEHELCKRAFWVLVTLDTMSSISMGRSCAIDSNHDMDLDMPAECDDEYWEVEDPKKRFRQPTGKPTTLSAFIHQLRLNRIMTFVMHSLYHVKSKKWEYLLGDWQKQVVEEMDSALNRWLTATPEHVKWDPQRTDEKFFKTSLMLMGWYYYVQILIHRPFIISQDRDKHPFPSLAICMNAARASSNLVDTYRKRGYPIHLNLILFAFTAGVVLSLNRWGKKNTDTRGVDEIYKCLDLLKVAEERWYMCGKAWDTLNGLIRAQEWSRAEASEGGAGSSGSRYAPTSIPSDAEVPVPASRARRNTEPRKVSSLSTKSDSNTSTSHRALRQSYHVGPATSTSASTPSSVGSAPSPFVAPLYPTPTPTPSAHAYPTPPESGTVDPRGVGMYAQSSSGMYEPNNMFSNTLLDPGFNAMVQPLAGMDSQAVDSSTINMWMNAPTGIGLDDWLNFLGGISWEEGDGRSGAPLE